ncbi:Rha family transcriptional regulator [uncultured Thiodictyon sp.]|uniref:Rha family transcriptional regulator n=1 Tax=uncultured Thiodictyon sp. TaxID=1846217 RepID=UPI0025F89B99|nr:Rha family transcriptional regulator [uncultured Thiodictyon sp.]
MDPANGSARTRDGPGRAREQNRNERRNYTSGGLAAPLVETRGQSALTTSLIVAEGCGATHKRAVALIRQYQDQFARLGRVDFERHPFQTQGGAQEREIALLNEDHATFLITLFRNTPVVVEFKVRLVLAFRRALNEIARLYANPPRSDLIASKRAAHNPMMDALIEVRDEAGKITGAQHFQCENKLCNFIVTGQFKAIDEKTLNNEQVQILRLVRERNAALLVAGLDYESRKRRLVSFATRLRAKRARLMESDTHSYG